MGAIYDLFSVVLPINRAPIFQPATIPNTSLFNTGANVNFARAYTNNEIVFSAIEMLATSAGEPHIVGRKWTRNSPQIRNETQRLKARGVALRDINAHMITNGYYKDLPDHPLIKLLDAPNPWMSRGQLWGSVVMDRCLAGNAYILKARGPMGNVGELWRLRPDWVRVVPGGDYIEAYEYGTGQDKVRFPAKDIIHIKTRNPADNYYGMSPLMAIAGRLDIDEQMRAFLRTFYQNGGTGPGSILSIKQKISQESKDQIRERFKNQFGGSGGFHEMMVLDQAEADYKQLGLDRGLTDALPEELNSMQEARISMIFGVPGSILGLLIGYESSSYANKRQDWQVFWDLTMTPMLSDFDDALNLQLVPDFGGIDEVLFDLSDIRALQEDVDKIHDRERQDFQGSGTTWREFREAIGKNPDVGDDEIVIVPANMKAMRVAELGEEPEPPPAPTPPPVPEVVEALRNTFSRPATDAIVSQAKVLAEARCTKCGRKVGEQVNVGASLHCPRCRDHFVVV